AVEEVRDRVPGAVPLQRVPLADRPLHVFLAAEAEYVVPVRVAAVPVDPAALERHRRRARLVVRLLALLALVERRPVLRLDRQARAALAAGQDGVAGGALDHLALDGLHPRAAGRPVLADAVQEDAAVARGLLPRRPGLLAPFELHDEVIVRVLLLRREAAEGLAGDADHAVLDGEDLVGV